MSDQWFTEKARLYAALDKLSPGMRAEIGNMTASQVRRRLNEFLQVDVPNGDPVTCLRQFADIAERKAAAATE